MNFIFCLILIICFFVIQTISIATAIAVGLRVFFENYGGKSCNAGTSEN